MRSGTRHSICTPAFNAQVQAEVLLRTSGGVNRTPQKIRSQQKDYTN